MQERYGPSRRGFLAAGGGLFGLTLLPASSAVAAPRARYSNPVTKAFTDVWADPTVLLAKDGYWYAYCTGDPILHRQGDYAFHKMGIARSADMVTWEYVADVFDEDPSWVPSGSFYWAPDIRYVEGQYYLYYSVAHFGPVFYTALAVATAPSPEGPWTDSGAPMEEARGARAAIDAALFTDTDGTRYMYWGSYREQGMVVAELTPDGTRIAGEPRQICVTGEAPYVVRRGDDYYLLFSDSTCCQGGMSGYTVLAGRSRSPLGPFVDREGVPLADARYGGTIVLSANGNRWVGTGHMSIATDLSGQDWLTYHAVDKRDPWLEPPRDGTNERPMLLDRLDWIDGWPTVRAGEWASDTPQPAPVARWDVGSHFHRGRELGDDWVRGGAARGGWRLVGSGSQDSHIRQHAPAAAPSYFVTAQHAPAAVRAEADLRFVDVGGAAGLVCAYRDEDNHVVCWLDADEGALVTDVRVRGRSRGRRRTALHDGFRFDTWHNVAAEIRDGELWTAVTAARQGAPLGQQQQRTLPGEVARSGSVGVASRSARMEADNVGGSRLYRPVTDRVPAPSAGVVLPDYSDDFDAARLDDGWAWVRDPAGELADGRYRWPTQDAALAPDANTASLLVRDAPDGHYLVETKVTLPLRSDMSGHYEAGLVAYQGDELNVRLTTSLFEPLYAPPTSLRLIRARLTKQGHGGTGWEPVGVPADTTWLRLACHVDRASGELEFRAATSRDGRSWTWAGTWSLPSESRVRIGLLSMGGTGAVAEFGYFRVHRLSSSS